MWCQEILDHMDGGVIQVKDGRVVNWSKGAEKIYRYTEQEILGKQVLSIVSPEWQEKMTQCLELLSYKEVPSMEMKHVGKKGQEIYIWVTFIPNYNSNKELQGIVLMTKDITEQKLISEKMQRLEELHLVGQMAASLGHEIRNPMSVVKGFLQILSEKNELYRYTDYLDMMISEINRVDSMMSEFLAFGRLNSGGVACCNLKDVIGAILPLIEVNANDLNQRVKVELAEVPDLELNEKEIRQMIMNLVRNGLEAMSAGGEITIRTFCEDQKVVLAVQDQGGGVPTHILENLGVPFTTTKGNGTGLGLSVCLQIVAKYHGEMDVQTSENGTTFYVKFPREF